MGEPLGINQGSTAGMFNGEKQYGITFVREGALHGQPWAFIEQDGEMLLAITRRNVTPDTLEECWGAYRQLECQASNSRAATIR
jgi:hypothetical protein